MAYGKTKKPKPETLYLLQEVEWLASYGVGLEEVARRMGRPVKTLVRRLDQLGRRDLVTKMNDNYGNRIRGDKNENRELSAAQARQREKEHRDRDRYYQRGA